MLIPEIRGVTKVGKRVLVKMVQSRKKVTVP